MILCLKLICSCLAFSHRSPKISHRVSGEKEVPLKAQWTSDMQVRPAGFYSSEPELVIYYS